jgi:hypothetical protein
MNKHEQRQVLFGEIVREQQSINRNLLMLADKDSTAKQRRTLTQVADVINKAVKHVKNIMAIS